MVIAVVAAALVGALIVVGMKAAKLGEELEQAELKLEAVQGERRVLIGKIEAMQEAERKMIGQLDSADQEIAHYREQLDLRPESKRKTYRILALGMKATGKTSLTLKWANPLTDLTSIAGTKIERYERSVSRVQAAKDVTEHVFEVHDWGGEHIVDAVQELITEEVHGLLLVVDLGGKDAKQVDRERVTAQLQEFQPQALRYFFVPKMMASCKTVVLFINKSDLIPGMPAQVEEQARHLYQPLIDSLAKYANQIDVKVFVGSANYGHATHFLFSHFVEKILPKNAYDNQLQQRMKADLGTTMTSTSTSTTAPFSFAAPPVPPVDAEPSAPSFGHKPHPQNASRNPLSTVPLVSKSNGTLPVAVKANGIAKHLA
ncbi:MAG: hypothetical protein IPM54_03600 [Polyangiaceae bacterium]|nr:hypothetical protein [Polyangiaceae bacterium]